MKKIIEPIAAMTALIICLWAVICPLSVRAEGFFIKGDVNGDGVFDSADLEALQKWLLAAPDAEPVDPRAADLCRDGVTDVFDLTAMRRKLSGSPQTVKISSPSCKAAAFGCINNGEPLYSENINEPVAPASLAKLLTASVALKYLSADTVITVGAEQSLVNPGSSLCLIQRGNRLKLYDLLTGMLMASGNDAAYTVAVSAARAATPDREMNDSQAVEYFVELMNEYASSIGMDSSNFVNPDGWDDSGQYTTVSDLMKLAAHAYSVTEIKEITKTSRKNVVFASGENASWTNTNQLLDRNSSYFCAEAVGMKTGTTVSAGNCFIAVFVRSGRTYISVVTGCESGNDRYELTWKLLSAYAP